MSGFCLGPGGKAQADLVPFLLSSASIRLGIENRGLFQLRFRLFPASNRHSIIHMITGLIQSS